MSTPVTLPVNPAAREDAAVRAFRAHLLAERNASALTAEGYEQDIAQYTRRIVRLRDGLVVSDEHVDEQRLASAVATAAPEAPLP